MFKLIRIYQEDRSQLEKFLNEQSEKGQHAEKINIFGIKFVEDKSKQYYYNVLYPNNAPFLSSEKNDNKHQSLFLNDFGLTSISSNPELLVYRSETKIDLFTDANIDDEILKKSRRKTFLNSLIFLFLPILLLGQSYIIGTYQLLISEQHMIFFSLNIMLLLLSIQRVLKSYQVFKGKESTKLGYRWKLNAIDPSYLLVLLLIGYASLIIIPSTGILIPILILFITITTIVINSIPIRKIFKILLLLFVMYLSVIFMLQWTLHSANSSASSNTYDPYISQSFLAKESHYIHSDTYIVELENTPLKSLIKNLFLKNKNIPESVEKNIVTKINNEYDYARYIYWDDNYIVLSSESFNPTDLIRTIKEE